MNSTLLIAFLILASSLCNLITSASIDYVYEYEDCECKNGGICALDNDFCVCKPGYTGRFCELRLDDSSNSCGMLLNNEQEFLDCAKCKCEQNVLTCTAVKLDTCNFNQFKKDLNITRKINLNNITNLKKLSINQLIEMSELIEFYAYKYYINEYKNNQDYSVVYSSLSSDAKPVKIKSEQRKKIIVYFSKNEKIAGLYFPFGGIVEEDTNFFSHNSAVMVNYSYTLNVFILIMLIMKKYFTL
jgi:hypothetical protein